MKKIIFAALSVLLIFGLVGCGVHTDYTPNKDFSAGDISGDINGWGSGVWDSADADKYEFTYQFTATKDMDSDGDGILKFKVRSTAGSWDTGDFGDATLTTDGTEVELKSADFGGPEALIPFEADHIYLITVTSKDGKVYAKVEDKGLDIIPVPFIFNGLFIVGNDFGWTTTALDNALNSYTKDLKGNVTYVKQFKAGDGDHNFRLCQSDWKGGFGTGAVAVGGDALTLSTNVGDNGEAPNVAITGLKAGNPYQMTITTTPDEVVTVAVKEICAINVELNIVGFPADAEGMTAYVNGTFAGWSGWTSAWGGTSKVSEGYSAVITDGKATITIFEEKVEDLGTDIVIEGCGYYGEVADDDIAKTEGEIKVSNDNFKASLKTDGNATWIITVDLEENTCKVAKE